MSSRTHQIKQVKDIEHVIRRFRIKSSQKMSGKLIMKRKMDKEQRLQPMQESIVQDNSTKSKQFQENGQSDESSNDSRQSTSSSTACKRLRCDTPPPEPESIDEHLPPILHEANNENLINNERNRHLLEAIQSKMLELQQELDEFEQDFGVNEEDFYNVASPAPQAEMSEQEAEALGYAMCAQETILFLQREGIPADSILYTRLRDALVGRTDQDRTFQI